MNVTVVKDARQRRDELVQGEEFVGTCEQFWNMLKKDKKGFLGKAEFGKFYDVLTACVVRSPLSMETQEAEEEGDAAPSTHEKMYSRFTSHKTMSSTDFNSFLFEVSDLWTLEGNRKDFLNSIFHRITKPKPAKKKPTSASLPPALTQLILRSYNYPPAKEIIDEKVTLPEDFEFDPQTFSSVSEVLRAVLSQNDSEESDLVVTLWKMKDEIMSQTSQCDIPEAPGCSSVTEEIVLVLVSKDEVFVDLPKVYVEEEEGEDDSERIVLNTARVQYAEHMFLEVRELLPSSDVVEGILRFILGRCVYDWRDEESIFKQKNVETVSFKYKEEDAEYALAKVLPPGVVVVGPRSSGRTSIGKSIAEKFKFEYICPVELCKKKGLVGKVGETLDEGETMESDVVISTETCAEVVRNALQSRSVKSKGYVIDDMPVDSNELMEFVRISGLRDVYPPSVIVQLEISEEEHRNRRDGMREDPITGKVYSEYDINEMKLSLLPPKKPEVGEDGEEPEEEEEDEEEKERKAQVEIILSHLVRRSEDVLDDMSSEDFPSYTAVFGENIRHVSVEAGMHYNDVLGNVMFHLRDISPYVPCRDMQPEESEEGESPEEISGIPSSVNSNFNTLCPVSLVEQHRFVDGLEDMTVEYRGKIYHLSSSIMKKRFLECPRSYIRSRVLDDVAPFDVVTITGAPGVGKTSVAQSIASQYNMKCIDVGEMRQQSYDKLESALKPKKKGKKKVKPPEVEPAALAKELVKMLVTELDLHKEWMFCEVKAQILYRLTFLWRENSKDEVEVPNFGVVLDSFPSNKDEYSAAVEAGIDWNLAIYLKSEEKEEEEEEEEVQDDEEGETAPKELTPEEKVKQEWKEKLPEFEEILLADVRDTVVGKDRRTVSVDCESDMVVDDIITATLRLIDPFKESVETLEAAPDEPEEQGEDEVKIIIESVWGNLGKFDPVEYRDRHVLVPGRPDLCCKYRGRHFLFSKEGNQRKFVLQPDIYIPIPNDGQTLEVPPPRIWVTGSRASGKTSIASAKFGSYGIPSVVCSWDFLKMTAHSGSSEAAQAVKQLLSEEEERRGNLLREKEEKKKKRKEKEEGEEGEEEEQEAEEEEEEEEEESEEEVAAEQAQRTTVLVNMFSALVSNPPYSRSGYVLDNVPYQDNELVQGLLDAGVYPEIIIHMKSDEEKVLERLLDGEVEKYKMEKSREREERLKKREEAETEEEEEEEEEPEEDEATIRENVSENLRGGISEEIAAVDEFVGSIQSDLLPGCVVSEVLSDPLQKVVSAKLEKSLSHLLRKRSGLLQNEMVLISDSVETAKRYIENGRKQLSMFSYSDPVICSSEIVIDRLRCVNDPTCSLVWGYFCFFFVSEDNLKKFAANPAKYVFVDEEFALSKCPAPRIAITGAPKVGKTITAKKLAKKFGSVYLNPVTVLERATAAMICAAKSANEALSSGRVVSGKLWMDMLHVVIKSADVTRYGFVLDEFLSSSNIALRIGEESIVQRVFLIEKLPGGLLCCHNTEDDTSLVLEESILNDRMKKEPVVVEKIVQSLRNSYFPEYVHVIPPSSSFWSMVNIAWNDMKKVLEAIFKCEKSAETEVCCVCDVPIPSHVFEEALNSEYGMCCPVSYVNEKKLVLCSGDMNRVFFVKCQNKFYCLSGEDEMKQFCNDPEMFVGKTGMLPDPLPESVTAFDLEGSQVELRGYCPVLLGDSPPNYPVVQKGDPSLLVEYDGKYFCFSSDETKEKFMEEPWRYCDVQLPAKLPIEKDEDIDVRTLSSVGYIENTVSEVVGEGLNDLISKRHLKHPQMGVKDTAGIFLALYLKANNSNESSVYKEHAQKKLEEYMKKCGLVSSLSQSLNEDDFIDSEKVELFDESRQEDVGRYISID